VPGLPKLAFLLPAIGLGYLGWQISRRTTTEEAAVEPERKQQVDKAQGENIAALLKVDELSLEIGFQLIPFVDEKQGGQMLARVRALRKHLATELGFLVPPIHISDNLRLKPREYVFSLRGMEIGRWQTEGNALLAVSAEAETHPLPGKQTFEPAFQVPARWISPALESQAIAAGYSVVDAVTVIGTHLAEMIRQHAHELLGRSETKRLLDTLNESHPKLVEELVPKVLTLGEVQKVLQQLLREQVSIRDLGTILEVLIDTATANKSTPHMVESVRQALARRIVQPLLESDGTLRVLQLDPAIEEEMLAMFQGDAALRLLSDGRPLGASWLKRLIDSVKQLIGNKHSMALPVLLCPSPARFYLRRWLEPVLPRVTVLSPAELPPDVRIRSAGVIR
jgi:flagellar biosynthesis protein FlhA